MCPKSVKSKDISLLSFLDFLSTYAVFPNNPVFIFALLECMQMEYYGRSAMTCFHTSLVNLDDGSISFSNLYII